MPFADTTLIGEGFAGEIPDEAHINVLIGRRGSPVETAFATALATPRRGHPPFIVCMKPGVAVKPSTLFCNKADLRTERHAYITWGGAASGVARAVTAAVEEGLIPREEIDDVLVICAAWVSWSANNGPAVAENNCEAALAAIRSAVAGGPRFEDVLAARDESPAEDAGGDGTFFSPEFPWGKVSLF